MNAEYIDLSKCNTEATTTITLGDGVKRLSKIKFCASKTNIRKKLKHLLRYRRIAIII